MIVTSSSRNVVSSATISFQSEEECKKFWFLLNRADDASSSISPIDGVQEMIHNLRMQIFQNEKA